MAIAAPVVISVVVPFPPTELNPNHSIDRREKAGFVAAYRRQCRVAALNVRRDFEKQGVKFPLKNPVTIIETYVLTSLNRRRDWRNLVASFKAGEDGLVDAGLITDDSIQVIKRLGLEVEKGPTACVRIRIEAGS